MVALETLSGVLGALFLVALVWASASLRVVEAGTSVITLRFGRPHRTLEPGLHVRLPGVDVWCPVVMGTQRQTFASDAVTADHQRVRISGELRFRVRSAPDFLHAERTFRGSLPATCEAVAGELVARHDLDQLIVKREQLRDELRFSIEDRVAFAGVSVEDVQIVTIEPAFRIGRLRAERTLLTHERELTRERLGIEREVRATHAEIRAHELRELNHVAGELGERSFELLRHEALATVVDNVSGRHGWPAPSSIDDVGLRR